MIIKVCGMRNPQNIVEVAALGVNWIGFIFYSQSPRKIVENEECRIENRLAKRKAMKNEEYHSLYSSFLIPHSSFQRVGVFVNATFEQMMETVNQYKLDYLQLHGNESPELCFALQKRGIAVIKAFSISIPEDLEKTKVYEDYVDYFLFDTKCEGYGGSGRSFDWSVLSAYKGNTSFLLSGGINPESVEALCHFSHPRLAGIDLNSGFEIEPGLKDIGKLKSFLSQLTINN